MKKVPISLVVITLNEEKNLARCLSSVPFADEIIVLDSGSTDQTETIAKSFGAKFQREYWRGYALQKRRALELASHDWVVSLDADEALDDEAQKSLMESWQSVIEAGKFARSNFYLGRWMRHGGMYPDYQIRYFNRQKVNWSKDLVHEKIEAQNVQLLKGNILHWSAQSLSQQVKTIDDYSALRAQEMAKSGVLFSPLKMLIKSKTRFLASYFAKRGFLDGTQGLIAAAFAGYSVFLRWAKLYEIQRKDRKSNS